MTKQVNQKDKKEGYGRILLGIFLFVGVPLFFPLLFKGMDTTGWDYLWVRFPGTIFALWFIAEGYNQIKFGTKKNQSSSTTAKRNMK